MLSDALGSPVGGVMFIGMATLLAYRVIASNVGMTDTSIWRITTALRVPLLTLTVLVGAAHWLIHG